MANLYKDYSFVLLLAVLCLTFLIRVPFLREPLDRDSATFALAGYKYHQGLVDYKDYIDNKPPGIHLAFAALFYFFKPTDTVVNSFVAGWAVLNTLLIYLLARALFTPSLHARTGCLLAVLMYGFFSSSPFIEGASAMTENFMVTFVIAAFYLLIRAEQRQKARIFFFSGLLFGAAFMFKQVAIFDYAAGLSFLALSNYFKKDRPVILLKKAMLSLSAFVTPLIAALLYFKYRGALSEFIFYCFTFNFKYIKLLGYSGSNYWDKFTYFNPRTFKANSIIWIGMVTFIIYLWLNFFSGKTINKDFFDENKNKFLLGLWGIFSFAGLTVSGRFFPHYYIGVLPSFILMSAFVLIYVLRQFGGRLKQLFVFTCLILSIVLAGHFCYYSRLKPEEISMLKYGWEPFAEAKDIGLYIRGHSKPADYIFVWAEEPQIHFYSLRNSPCKYWSDTYFIYYHTIDKDKDVILLSSLNKKTPLYFVVDTRHLPILKSYPKIYDYVMNNYFMEKDFPVIRDDIRGYSLLLYRLNS